MESSSDFNTKYQSSKFKEDPKDIMKLCFHKRFCAYQMHQEAVKKNSNQTSCFVLKEKLSELNAYVDNRKTVNNFANLAKSLCENVTNNCHTWESGLESANDLIDLIPKPVDCANPSANGCLSALPYEENVNIFFSALEEVRKTPKPTTGFDKKTSLFAQYRHDTDENIESTANSSLNSQPIKKPFWSKPQDPVKNNPVSLRGKKESLFSSYNSDNSAEKVPSAPEPISNQNFPASSSGFSFPKCYQNSGSNVPSNKPSLLERTSQDLSRFTLPGPKRANKNASRAGGKRFQPDPEDFQKDDDSFLSARQALIMQQNNKKTTESGPVKKSLGGKGKVSSNRFVPPLRNSSQEESVDSLVTRAAFGGEGVTEEEVDERLRHIDPKMIEKIKSEIVDKGPPIGWDDIAGLEFAKNTIQEIVVWPMLRPDIFTGLRRPPRGILLFGPPGTGKTLIGKCIASQSKSTFFSISASSLTSKWIGDGEKMVRALFAVARVEQPAVVFIDEIDSLLSQRSETEHESSRRLKTEFLVQLDGAGTGDEDRLLIIGATNRPQELDEAARRRLVKRLYIPLPDIKARKQLVNNLMKSEKNSLTDTDLDNIANLTDGYSGADMRNLCQEACLGPIRSISMAEMTSISTDQVRPVSMEDFKVALQRVRSSVSEKDLDGYIAWDQQFGMSSW